MARAKGPGLIDHSRGLIDPKELDKFILACQETARYCQQCAAAGLDVGPEAKKNDDQLQTALALKRTYFPTRT